MNTAHHDTPVRSRFNPLSAPRPGKVKKSDVACEMTCQTNHPTAPKPPVEPTAPTPLGFDNGGSMQSSPAQQLDTAMECAPSPTGHHCADWYRLPDNLHELTHVVEAESHELARTTMLTWLYRERGVMSFLNIAEKILGEQTTTQKKKMARRALAGLEGLGAIRLVTPPKDGNHSDDETQSGADAASEGETGSNIGKRTIIYITAAGMTWMNRAWQARSVSMGRKQLILAWIHSVLLTEEEEGKGNAPHWLEDHVKSRDPEAATYQLGSVSNWIGPAVNSVFGIAPTAKRKNMTT